MKQIKKVKAFINLLEKNKSKLSGEWSCVLSKNGRGDYGCDEKYFYNSVLSHVISVDGARINIKFYIADTCPVATQILDKKRRDG